ncbi:DUF4244 domain-containing protein [Bifidobacterium sp. UBA744]|uniref:DUF4244 domain-containing protein n=1 Tax=Bifidobacterium sp. UBA744 TaxID=1946112 RepID=UPI0025C21EEF|nr:DUF4244 domain-containing protein [Bifidobacterium sp. UBA744]
MTVTIMSPTTPVESMQPGGALRRWKAGVERGVCALDARLRTMTVEPERGAATVEYALIVVAAAAFAGILIAVIKSGFVKTLITNIIKTALGTG